MPLPGGAADKYGNRYEGRWTVLCMLSILAGEANTIWLEPVGDEGEGVEFRLTKGKIHEYHQVKRQNSASGYWSLADLRKVLVGFSKKLSKPKNFCVFVSSHSAYQLQELSDRVHRSASFSEYSRYFIGSKEWKGCFTQLCGIWNCDSEQSYEYLKRIKVVTVDEEIMRDFLYQRVKNILYENAQNQNIRNLVDVLAQFALDSIHTELKIDRIWEHLESRDFKRLPNPREQDVKIIRFFRSCFDREAFKARFRMEGSGYDMVQAIEDTILAINTGEHFDRKGRHLKSGMEKGRLSNDEWYQGVEEIVDILSEINRRYQDGIDKDLIIHDMQQGQGFWFVRDGELADWIDSSRIDVIERFSKICEEAGIRPLSPLK
jgi:hypothetical protein